MKIRKISWQQVPGNRFGRALHKAMLSERGYIKAVRLPTYTGDSQEVVDIHYDKEYVIAWLVSKIIRPLVGLSFQEFIDLLKEAWEKELKDSELTQLPIK
jgi:hypothetical protein